MGRGRGHGRPRGRGKLNFLKGVTSSSRDNQGSLKTSGSVQKEDVKDEEKMERMSLEQKKAADLISKNLSGGVDGPRGDVKDEGQMKDMKMERKDEADLAMPEKNDGGVAGSGGHKTPERFQQILKERKAEFKRESEKKRLEGMRKIAERKSRTGINPLERFPKEIWVNLLEELGPSDLKNLREVHDLFRNLTDDIHIRDILLPLVVGHLIPVLRASTANNALKEIRILRSISKSSREYVDLWIEKNILECMRNPQRSALHSPFPRYKLSVTDSIDRLNKLLAFSREHEDSRPKKFPLRALQVDLKPHSTRSSRMREQVIAYCEGFHPPSPPPSVGAQREMLQRSFDVLKDNIIELLETVGDQILFFELSCEHMKESQDLGLSIVEIYGFLSDCLQLMPNLKWLVLQSNNMDSLVKKPQWRDQALQGLKNHPMPRLAKLERMDSSEWANVMETQRAWMMWDCIFTANPHVKYHSYRSMFTNDDRFTMPVVLSLPLEYADLGHRRQMWNMPLIKKISPDCKWNLKQFKLMMNFKNEDGGLKTVFQLLEKFPNLEHLSLAVNYVKFEADLDFLRLPKLRKLRLDIGPVVRIYDRENGKNNIFFSLHFLFHCVNLETLVWNNLTLTSTATGAKQRHQMEQQGNGDSIDFRGGFQDLRGSNVWEVFPKLRDVSLKFRERLKGGKERYYSRYYRHGKLIEENNLEWNEDRLYS